MKPGQTLPQPRTALENPESQSSSGPVFRAKLPDCKTARQNSSVRKRRATESEIGVLCWEAAGEEADPGGSSSADRVPCLHTTGSWGRAGSEQEEEQPRVGGQGG